MLLSSPLQTWRRSSDQVQLIAESLQSISREWMEFARSRLERNLAHFDELARCRTPQDLAAVKSEAVRDNLEGA
jgi:Phasin protein